MVKFKVVYGSGGIWSGEMECLPPINSRLLIEGFEYRVDKIVIDTKTKMIQVQVELLRAIR